MTQTAYRQAFFFLDPFPPDKAHFSFYPGSRRRSLSLLIVRPPLQTILAFFFNARSSFFIAKKKSFRCQAFLSPSRPNCRLKDIPLLCSGNYPASFSHVDAAGFLPSLFSNSLATTISCLHFRPSLACCDRHVFHKGNDLGILPISTSGPLSARVY